MSSKSLNLMSLGIVSFEIAVLSGSFNSVYALNITPSIDAEAMAEALLGEDSAISLVPGSAVYTGANGAAGFSFDDGFASGLKKKKKKRN